MKEKYPFLGAHISIAGGVDKAPERGKNLSCDAIQIFSKNQNQWKAKPLTQDIILAFRKGVQEHQIKSVLIHDSYLINLASPDPELLNKSITAFTDEIDRAELLQVFKLVFHPGSHTGAGEETGLKTIAQSLNKIIDTRPQSKVKLLLETTAGQGSNLGYRFEQLSAIIEMVEDKDRLEVCYDTQHTFAAGYDLRSQESYEAVWRQFDEIIGFKRLTAFHLNDSKKKLSSRIDRHEHIGEGLVGIETFRRLLNDPRFFGLGMYLETPQGDEEYFRNLKLLRSLLPQ